MIVFRIADGITSHFPARVSEWVLSGMLVGWGTNLLRPEETFASSRSYSHMAKMAAEPTWGWSALAVGGIRLAALTINGTFASTRYGKVSPHVRGITAFLSCFVWLQIWLGLIGSGESPPGVPIYFGLLCLDIFNTARAFGDAGEIARAKKHGITP